MPKSKRRLTRRQKIAKGLTRPKRSKYLEKKISEQRELFEGDPREDVNDER